ncbi:hypothetical protein MHU86_11633 [Fragilaria crotonensis]|nr:hypothetical protein MHU86_11633 [Fragilaria crotonensis]
MTTDGADKSISPVHQGDSSASLVNVEDEQEGEFVDNYDLTLGDNDDFSLSEKMVHYCGGQILQVRWSACKAVLAFYAGSRVSKLKSSKKPEMERECLEIYYNAIEELDVEHFNKDAREFFCHSFQKKGEPMPAHSLWRYYYDSRAKIRREVLQYFPKDLVTMKSGRGFHESCNDVYVKAYRSEMGRCKTRGGAPKYTAEEIEEMHPPHHWEYTKSPWHFGLLVKDFRRDPQLALHVASVMSDPANTPASRAELRHQKQVSLLKKKRDKNKENRGPPRSINISNATKTSSSLSCLSTSSVGRGGGLKAAANVSGGSEFADSAAEEEEKRVNDAKILISTTHANQHLLNRRMGKLDEIERTMAALEKMKPYIPAHLYAEKMRSAFASLPVFDTYETDVCDPSTACNGRSNKRTRVCNNDDTNDDDVHRRHDTTVMKKTKSVLDEEVVLDDDDGDAASINICGSEHDNEKQDNCDNNNDCVDDESSSDSSEESLHGPPVVLGSDDTNGNDNFWDCEDKDLFPIVDRNGKMIGMKYSFKDGKKTTPDGRPMRYLWENFMDRFDTDDEHYPIVDETGKMTSLGDAVFLKNIARGRVPHHEAVVAKEHHRKKA